MRRWKADKHREKRQRAVGLDDAYTAMEAIPEEERHPSKFDGGDFEDWKFDGKDEEIDEDLAFTAEDAERYAEVFGTADETMASDVIQTVNDPNELDALFDSHEESNASEELEEITDSDDGESHRKLVEAVIGKGKRRVHIRSESGPEGMLNVIAKQGDGEKEQMADLLSGAGGIASLSKGVRKSLDVLNKQQPLTVPLPKRIEDRQLRKAGYAHAVEDLTKWDDLVYVNRMAPTLEFAPPNASLERPHTLEEMVDAFEPESQMEKEIAAILESSGIGSEEQLVRMEEEEALKHMTVDELKKKKAQLAKMRSLLFHHEVKARHVKKIKSKEYRRRLNRAIRKKATKFGGLDSEAAAKKMLEEMSYSRMKERLTQKHSTMNRFARRIMRRGWGVADEQTKQALEEQLRQNQELKQKIQSTEGRSSEENVSSSESEEDGPAYKKTRKALLKVIEGEAEDIPKTGIIALPFMQKALKNQKESVEAEASKMLQEIDGTQEETDNIQKTRFQIGQQSNQQTADPEFDNDDNNARLSRKLRELSTKKQDSKKTTPKASVPGRQVTSAVDDDVRRPASSSAHDYLFRKGRKKAAHAEEVMPTPTVDPSSSTNPSIIPETKTSHSEPTIAENEHAERSQPQIARNDHGDAPTADGLTQEQLIEMAFADDDIHDEFQQEKEHDIVQELPKMEEVSLLPGWGRWKDDQEEPRWMQNKRTKNTAIHQKALGKRKDAKKPFVFISEKPTTYLDKYKASGVPHTFPSVEAYKASLRHPIGPDVNTAAAFEDFVRPKVLKRKGVIIEPLKLSRNRRDVREHIKEVKQGNVKVRRIVGGEIKEQVVLDEIIEGQRS